MNMVHEDEDAADDWEQSNSRTPKQSQNDSYSRRSEVRKTQVNMSVLQGHMDRENYDL